MKRELEFLRRVGMHSAIPVERLILGENLKSKKDKAFPSFCPLFIVDFNGLVRGMVSHGAEWDVQVGTRVTRNFTDARRDNLGKIFIVEKHKDVGFTADRHSLLRQGTRHSLLRQQGTLECLRGETEYFTTVELPSNRNENFYWGEWLDSIRD